MATYEGDINRHGNIVPVTVDVVNGVHREAAALIRQETGARISGTFGKGIGALWRGMEVNAIPPMLMYGIRVGVGMNTVNMSAAEQQGLATLSTPGGSTNAVARRAQTFALAWASELFTQSEKLRGHQFVKKGGKPLDRMTTGVVGFGRIGQEFAGRICHDTQAILAYDPHIDWSRVKVSDALYRKLEVVTDLDELVRKADIVSSHIGGSEEVFTPGIIRKMKTDGLFINTGRAANVHKKALLQRMRNGLSVALDVFWDEGQDMFNDPDIRAIVESPNFMGTAHTAASDDETQRLLSLEGARAMVDFITQGVINRDDLPGHTIPAVVPAQRKHAGVRACILHTSRMGTLAAITSSIAHDDLQITGFWNSEDEDDNEKEERNGEQLAYTVVNMGTQNTKQARRIMNRIEDRTIVLKSRLLFYSSR